MRLKYNSVVCILVNFIIQVTIIIKFQWLEKQIKLYNHYDHIKGSIRDSKIYLKF